MNNQDQKISRPIHIHKEHRSHKKLLIIVLVVIVIAIGALGTWFVVSNKQQPPKALTNEELIQAVRKAQTLSNNGDVNGALTAYDDLIDNTKDDRQKGVLLMDKAVLYFNETKYEDALTAAIESESFYQNSSTASYIAKIYETKGDSENAIEYYQKAITLVDKNNPVAGDDVEYFNLKIDELGKI